jgi:aminoacyl tRNA synthase complex-interacting multifunctional protein 1
MSFQEVVRLLPEPSRNLVLAAAKDVDAGPSTMYGASEKDAAEMKTWIEKASKPDEVFESNIKVECENYLDLEAKVLIFIKSLDAHLVSRTFLVSNYLTAADVAIYGALHPFIVCPWPILLRDC